MIKYFFAFSCLALVLGGAALPCAAAGLLVRPDNLKFEAAIFRSSSKEILVTNAGQEPGAYQLTFDSHEKYFKASPAEFVLEAGAAQMVNISVTPVYPLDLKTNISVVARPLTGQGLLAAPGVKIPVAVSVFPGFAVLLFLLIVCLGVLFGVKYLILYINNNKLKS